MIYYAYVKASVENIQNPEIKRLLCKIDIHLIYNNLQSGHIFLIR